MMIKYIDSNNLLNSLLNGKQIDQLISIDSYTVKFATVKVKNDEMCKMSIWTVDQIDGSYDVYSFPFSDPDDPAIDIAIENVEEFQSVIIDNGMRMDRFVEFPGLESVYMQSKVAQQGDAPESRT